MYGFQLEQAQVGLVMKLECLGVPMLVVNVGEGDLLSLGTSPKAGEDGVLRFVGECGDGRSRFWVVLAVLPVGERFGHSN